MCGIAGVFAFNGQQLRPERLAAMADIQTHRGPDGEGMAIFGVSDGSASFWERSAPPPPGDGGLAHRRLAIIDLSERGRQPMQDAGGRLWITYNGEIYNYVELMEELSALGYEFQSRTDTEVILNAYREWGDECVHHLNGMFAFALWDTERRRLFCARDRLGIKPFYYRYQDRTLTFASEIKAILAYGDEAPAAHVPAMTDFLCYSFVPSADTFFRGISKLPPGHHLVADAAGLTVTPYWNIRFEEDTSTDDEHFVDELRGLLDDAVRIQLRSDVPVGAHLSGGIDSSTVCCLAARHNPHLNTFTARFAEGGFFDESEYARLVADRINSNHREIVPSGGDVRELLPRIIYHLDEPVEGTAVFGKFHVAQLVGDHVKVVLGGQGGDELFGGYDWYVKSLFVAAFYGGRNVLGQRARLPFALACARGEDWKRLARSLWNNFGCADVGTIFNRNWHRPPFGVERRLMRGSTLNGSPSSSERFAAAFDALPEDHPGDRMFHFDVNYYLPALLHSEDRLSMAFSVESRVPLLDHRIAELAARLGFRRKTVPGQSKDFLRRAAANILPTQIIERRDKRGFPTPIKAWLRDPELGLVERFVLDGNRFASELFDLDRVRALARQRVSLGTSWSETLWRVITLSAWGERFDVTV